jgi:hypothetical protein
VVARYRDRPMSYNWWVFLHVACVFAFVGTHGVSMVVLYRLRRERDRRRIGDLIAFSGSTVRPMYICLLAVIVTGVVTALRSPINWFTGIPGDALSSLWIWSAIGVLIVTSVLMSLMAAPYFKRVTEACAVRPTGVPRKSDEELDQILRGPAFHGINLVGLLGLLVILYLMIFKPGVG